MNDELLRVQRINWPSAPSDEEQGLEALRAAYEASEAQQGFRDPFLFKQMAEAVDVFCRHLNAHSRILIHGDYDADGLTASALWVRFCRQLGLNASVFIPSRLIDGYGLSQGGVKRAIAMGAKLVITVDCGSGSYDEIQQLRAAGIEVILTDHHQCQDPLPIANACLNPQSPSAGYPFKGLCGAGVALKLIQGICQTLGLAESTWRNLLDLAAIGTVADLMPLTDENVALVREGLAVLNSKPQPGLARLPVYRKPIQARGIGFQIAPRLNAAGRMGNSVPALELLTSDEPGGLQRAAEELEQLNQQRRELAAFLTQQATQQVEAHPEWLESAVLVVSDPTWHAGVLGLIASALVSRFQRSVICLGAAKSVQPISSQTEHPRETLPSTDGQAQPVFYLSGSGRACGAFHLLDCLSAQAAYLVKYGGHAQAAGVTIQMDQISAWRSALREAYPADTLGIEAPLKPHLYLSAQAIGAKTHQAIQALAPFGQQRPEPLIGLRGHRVTEVRKLGVQQAHLRFSIADEAGNCAQVIAFNARKQLAWLKPGQVVDVLGHLNEQVYQGRVSYQLMAEQVMRTDVEALIWAGKPIDLPAGDPSEHFDRGQPDPAGAEPRVWTHLPPSWLREPAKLRKCLQGLYQSLITCFDPKQTGPLRLDGAWLAQLWEPILGGWPSLDLVDRLMSLWAESAILTTKRWSVDGRFFYLCWQQAAQPEKPRVRLSQTGAWSTLWPS